MEPGGAMPNTQKAWMVMKQGKPRDALVFKTDAPVPKPKPGEVLVRVRAAALNPVGWKVMCTLPDMLSRRPHPAEHDLAGVIIDANGTSFSNGDEIVAFIPVPLQFTTRQGALAQYVALPQENVSPKPVKLSWEESAALPLAALTAVQSLRLGGYDPVRALGDASAITSDNRESIFINGGSTAVGICAIQLAKALSLHVTASASARNESFVRGVGADAFLDYTAQPIAEQLSANPPTPRFGMIFDAAGLSDTALYTKSEAYVKKSSVYVTTGPWAGKESWAGVMWRWAGAILRPSFIGGVSTAWKFVSIENKKEDMMLLSTLIERGIFHPYLDSTYEFGSALDAYDKILTGRATGKIVVKVE